MINKKYILEFVFLITVLLSVSFISSAYVRSVNYGQYTGVGGGSLFGETASLRIDQEMCEEGTDFLLQLTPFGCTPAVVRSDLLEEQDVHVFCQIGATQINPLIDVEAIRNIKITGDLSRDVRSVAYHPAQAALGLTNSLDVNSPVLENLGYVVVTLKQNSNESSMPDYVEGNLSAELKYDIKNAFGIGAASFYLPVMSDSEWEERYIQYGFWQGRGYLRAEGIGDDYATFSIYADDSVSTSSLGSRSGRDYSKIKYAQVNLGLGDKSEEIYLPGFSPCLASLSVRLDDLENPDTLVKLKINEDVFEVKDGEKFLDNKCEVVKIHQKEGLNQRVSVRCEDDEKPVTFDLAISPGISLKIDDSIGDYVVGDMLFKTDDNSQAVYLGYVGSTKNSKNIEDLYIVLVALPVFQEDGLTAKQLSSIATHIKYKKPETETGAGVFDAIATGLKGTSGMVVEGISYVVSGKDFEVVNFIGQGGAITSTEKFGKKILINGFSDASNNGFMEIVRKEYNLDEISDGGYSIKDGDVETGLILVESPLDENKFYLAGSDALTAVATAGIIGDIYHGVFNGENCDENGKCDKYVLSTKEDYSPRRGFNDFFQNLVSAEIIDGKLIAKKLKFIDFEQSGVYESYYRNAMDDFETVVNSYPGEKISAGINSDNTYGEEALYAAVMLAKNLGQKKTMLELCKQFKEEYPDSDKILDNCDDEFFISNSRISTYDVLIDGYLKRISFEGISEPNSRDFSAIVVVKGPNGKQESILLRKDTPVYLSGFREDIVFSVESKIENKDKKVYFKFASDKWYWSYERTNWQTLSSKKIIESPVKENSGLFSELINKDFSDGEEILIKYNAEKETSEIETEFLELRDLDEDSADIYFSLADQSFLKENFVADTKKLEFDETKSFGSGYNFRLSEINLNKVARVSIVPNINYAKSEAEFKFKIGIEKRAIQLSPERINDKIEALNRSIEDWQKAYDTLNGINKGLKTACIGLGTTLTIKNLLTNSGGKAIARQEVMNADGGWTEFCKSAVAKGEYSSMDKCFLDNANDIDKEVDQYYTIMRKQDEKIKEFQDDNMEDGGVLGRDYVDQEGFIEDYSAHVSGELYSVEGFDMNNVKEIIKTGGNSVYSTDDLREIEFYSLYLKEHPGDSVAQERLKSLYAGVEVNAGNLVERNTLAGVYGIDGSKIGLIPVENVGKRETLAYQGLKTNDKIKINGVEKGVPVYIFQDERGDSYTIILDDSSGNENLFIAKDEKNNMKVYDEKGVLVKDTNVLNALGKVDFKKYDSTSFENTYKNPEVRYYETDPYTGYPEVVPVDTKNGWYAYVKSTISVGGNIASYDASGVVNIFYLCNVGSNGLEENIGGDDIYQLVNLNNAQSNTQFYGVSDNEFTNLISKSVNAINDAQNAYRNGLSRVRIGGQTYDVGEPAANTPLVQCQDFMSPKECNLLFNVCDPVICPSSRCDLGGIYPVRDVIQSGIIGSVALCLPNFPETKIPVCLTGIAAGIDGWNSVQKSYRDCLQTNLDTGKTIGICDEIHSIYVCEFFWRQSLPIIQLALPKIISAALGESTRGGGEYLGVESAWENARNSMEYFTQYYAANSYAAFKIRSVEDAGGTVCKGFISASYPGSGSFLDALTEPDSPVQFHGQFDEIQMTTATNPPTSHYKVFYHIYAGRDTGVYYQVKLRGSGTSYYQDTNFDRIVASDYIPVGEYATDTVDFTAPSGYNEMCISVNGQEECGFKQVTTSFAVDYLTEEYVASQADDTDIKTESECVSGSASLAALLLNPNLEAGVDEVIDPELYNRGIIRTCATNNPGVGADGIIDESIRWVDVGYCGDENLRCWLDKQSVKEVIKATNIENETLEKVSGNYLNLLANSGEYLSKEEFRLKVNEVNALDNELDKVSLIGDFIDSVFYNNNRAEILFLRGTIYANLAWEEYKIIEDTMQRELLEEEKKEEIEEREGEIASEETFSLGLNEKHEFTYKNEKYTIEILEIIDNEHVKISIGGSEEEMAFGEKKGFDLDKDGEQDIILIITDIDEEKRIVGIKLTILSEKKVSDLEELAEKIAAYEGYFVNEVQSCAVDSGYPSANCYNSLMVIYDELDVGLKCIFSGKNTDKLPGTNIEISGETGNFKNDCGGTGSLNEKDKLALLKPGYQFDALIHYKGDTHGNSNYAAHSLVFLSWKDEDKNIANVFDWNGETFGVGWINTKDQKCEGDYIHTFVSGSKGCKTYRVYDELDLSNSENYIYLIRSPLGLESKETEEEVVKDDTYIINRDEFSKKELEIIDNAEKCEDCGKGFNIFDLFGNKCDENECKAIGVSLSDVYGCYPEQDVDDELWGVWKCISVPGENAERIYFKKSTAIGYYTWADCDSYVEYERDLVSVKFIKSFEEEILYFSRDKTSFIFDGKWEIPSELENSIYTLGKNSFSDEVKITYNKGEGLKEYVLVDVKTYKRFSYFGTEMKFIKDAKANLYYSRDGGVNWKRADSDMLEEYNKNSLVDLSGYAKVSLSGLVSEYKIIYSGEEISVDINSFKKLSVNFITFNFVKSKEGELYLSKGVVSEDLEGEWILADKDEINIYNSGENYFSKGVTINHNKGLGLKDNVLVDTNTYKEFEYALKDTKFVKDMKGKLYYSTDAGFNWKRADDSMEEEYNKN